MAELMEVGEVMAFLSTIWPEKQVTKDTMKAYHVLLCDIPKELLMAAAIHLAATSQWLPKPKELREAAAELDARSRNAEMPTAEEAWLEVTAAIRSHGHVRLPDWSHEMVGQAVLAMGGWRTICLSDNPVADRAHFLKVYTGLYTRGKTRSIEHPAIAKALESLATGKALPAGPVARLMSGED